MILKDKKLQNVKAANAIAGQKQEQDVAFFLRREFKNHPQVFVINDFKFLFNNETAQIDHLIVYPYGFIIVESKSITGEVTVNELGEWTRSSNGKWSGMPSPIKQAELQQKLLREFLHHHRAKIMSKLFGIKQQSFGKRCWNNLCAVSSNSIIDRKSIPKEVSQFVVKNEFLIDKINEVMAIKSNIIKSMITFDTRPDFNDEELKSITNFLMKNITNNTQIKNIDKALTSENQSPVISSIPILKCKKCNESSNFTAQHGRYGYFINCNECNTNTPMKIPCNRCHSKKTKVSKKLEEYTLNCSDCNNQLQLI